MKLIKLIFFILLLSTPTYSQTTLKIMSMNLQHGQGTDLNFNFARQVNVAAANNVDVIVVQERSTTETGWNTPLSDNGYSETIFTPHPGVGDGPAIWIKNSTITSIQTWTFNLPNTVTNPTSGSTSLGWDGSTDIRRAIVAAKLSKGGIQFNVVGVHFCPSRCNNTSSTTISVQRNEQVTGTKNWINSNLSNTIKTFVVGDYNFAPDYPGVSGGFQKDILTSAGFTDYWTQGISTSTATVSWADLDANSIADMPLGDLTSRTADSRRIDNIYGINGSWNLTNITILDNRTVCPHALVAGGTFPSCSPEVNGGPGVSGMQWDIPEDFGVRPSDHNYVLATFTTTTIKKCNFHTNPSCSP